MTDNSKLIGKIILALDVDSFRRARYFVDKLYPRVKIFKVGLQLFTACGPRIIEYIRRKGGSVFLDLKLFDIPNTVASAVVQAAALKVKMLTLHIAGGEEMLRAAVGAAKAGAGKPLLIGVTVLTSQKATPAKVLKFSRLGLACGLDGVVCSAKEARLLRRAIKKKYLIIAPGIRLKSSAADDQKRTMTAQEAAAAGSDFLVVGRPILKAKDPIGALKEICAPGA